MIFNFTLNVERSKLNDYVEKDKYGDYNHRVYFPDVNIEGVTYLPYKNVDVYIIEYSIEGPSSKAIFDLYKSFIEVANLNESIDTGSDYDIY